MTGQVRKLLKELIVRVYEKLNVVKEFWAFVKNPRKPLNGSKVRSACPDVLRNSAYGTHKFCQLPENLHPVTEKRTFIGGLNHMGRSADTFLIKMNHKPPYSLKDVRLHYVESGPKDKELLLFVHGFPDFWFTWKHQILEFSKDYWTVAVDMRGYGDSEKRKTASWYKINFLVDDIRNLVLALGKNKFTLIAHDWGGVVAHYFIRIYPDMLNRYVLLNTVFHPKLGATFVSDTKQFFKSWYILIFQIPYYAEYFFLHDDLKNMEDLYKDILSAEELEAYKFMFGNYDKIRPPINYYRANFKDWKKGKIPDGRKLNARKVFGLYIHGENDFALTKQISYGKSFEDVENIRFAPVPNAGHFVHIHSPETVNRIMRNFLQPAS